MKKWVATIVVGLVVGLFSSMGIADNNFSGNVGLLGGIASLNNGGGSPFTYGVMANYVATPNWIFGLQFNSMSPSVSVLGTSYSQTLSNLDAVVEYSWDMWKVGILLGTQMYSSTVPGATNSSNFNYGLVGAYDWMLGTNFSVGPQVEAIWTSQSGGYTEIDFLAALKYWF